MGSVSRYNYLVILLPGARAALVDNFACEQRVLGGIHLRVLGLLRESLEALDSCREKGEKMVRKWGRANGKRGMLGLSFA